MLMVVIYDDGRRTEDLRNSLRLKNFREATRVKDLLTTRCSNGTSTAYPNVSLICHNSIFKYWTP